MTGEKKSIKVQPAGPAGYAGFHHLTYPPDRISESPIRNFTLDDLVQASPLSFWSALIDHATRHPFAVPRPDKVSPSSAVMKFGRCNIN
jgi:hypothetical protein